MMQFENTISFLILGLSIVTVIDTVGAIASRYFRFNYGYLSIFSFSVYFLIGYLASTQSNLNIVLLVSVIVGIYDATVGWKLCLLLKANFTLTEEQVKKTTLSFRLAAMLICSSFFACLGYWVATA
jgi:hypothetical protein